MQSLVSYCNNIRRKNLSKKNDTRTKSYYFTTGSPYLELYIQTSKKLRRWVKRWKISNWQFFWNTKLCSSFEAHINEQQNWFPGQPKGIKLKSPDFSFVMANCSFLPDWLPKQRTGNWRKMLKKTWLSQSVPNKKIPYRKQI